MLVAAQSVVGPQNELVSRRNMSGTQTSYGSFLMYATGGMVNANRSARTSFRRLYASNAVMRNWIATTVESVSRVACATSTTPESSYACVTLVRKTCVLRSIASATTAGLGGRGTLDANERFESADARGVLARAERARVVAGSTSESSLYIIQYLFTGSETDAHRRGAFTHVARSSSAAFVTLRFTDFTVDSISDANATISFFTGEPLPRVL
jgi:hypothetical protein